MISLSKCSTGTLLLVVAIMSIAPPGGNSLPVMNVDGRPETTVTQGKVIGTNETEGGINILHYRSIPYAEPPRGQLRFMAPVPAAAFNGGELDASDLPPPCTQFVATGREDCLYLNVHAPESTLSVISGGDPVPVMVYIHGGGFFLGQSALYDEVYPLVRHDVIVVIIQYRLGVLGFFTTDDSAAPGNQGLMDQTLGLQWVKDNIADFGGDSDNISIFGQSAGSASVHYQLLTPSSAGLFQRAIMQSGNAFTPWSRGRDFYNVSRTIAQRFNCDSPTDDSAEIVTCLQDVNFLLLSDMYFTFIEWNAQPFIFGPRIDGTYIPEDPVLMVLNGNYHQVPTIMGATRDEGALESGEMYLLPRLIDSLLTNFTTNGPISCELYEDEEPVSTATAIYEYYLGEINITNENANELTKLYTELLFHIDIDWLVQTQSPQTPVYMYQFNHRGDYGLMDTYAARGLNLSSLPGSENWVAHSDDIQYMLPRNMSGSLQDPDDLQISQIFTTMWTNFAKFGTPTPDSSLLGFVWPPTTPALDHLSIEVPPAMHTDERAAERVFWESLPLRINDILHP